MSVYERFLKVQSAIRPVAKDGENEAQGYKYVTEAALLDQVKPLLKDNGLVVIPTTTREETGYYETKNRYDKTVMKNWAKVEITFRIVEAETGVSFESIFMGYAEDTGGDKAIYKAMTGATKYFYMKVFGVATGDDPENEKAEKGDLVALNSRNSQSQPTKESSKQQLPEEAAAELRGKIRAKMKNNSLDPSAMRAITELTTLDGQPLDVLVQAYDKIQQFLKDNKKQA